MHRVHVQPKNGRPYDLVIVSDDKHHEGYSVMSEYEGRERLLLKFCHSLPDAMAYTDDMKTREEAR